MNNENLVNMITEGKMDHPAAVAIVGSLDYATDTAHEKIKECQELQKQFANQQSEIDRLTAQNLQLRLICDRAMALVLTGEKPDVSKMTPEQGKSLNAYLDVIDYNDLEESNSTEDMVIGMMIEPLVRIACNSPDETNLLSFAISEQNRRALVDQEIDQLRELQKLKPNYAGSILMAVMAFDFSRRAGDPGINHSHLINDYAPSVILAREAGVRIQPDDVEQVK